jgi:hypothetical protein
MGMLRKNKLLAIVVIMVLMLFLVASVAGARGPANRATGSVWIEHSSYADTYVEFNAHAESPDGRRAAKGTLYWYSGVEGKTLEEIKEMNPTFTVNIKYVNVQGDSAWFAGPRSDQNRWLFVKVVDGGSPGFGNDYIPLENLNNEEDARNKVEGMTDPGAHNWTIYGGNLVVHYYQ